MNKNYPVGSDPMHAMLSYPIQTIDDILKNQFLWI